MPIDYKKYPSNWKTEIRPAIMERAKNCCEFCGVKHYSVGNWNGEKFIPTGGNITHDAAGNGELTYKEARQLVVFGVEAIIYTLKKLFIKPNYLRSRY